MSAEAVEAVKDQLRVVLRERFGVDHTTFETVPEAAEGDTGTIADE